MNVTEIQNKLIRGILNTTDLSILERVTKFFKSEKIIADWWDEISDYEKQMVEEGLKDIENGEVTSWEQVRNETQEIIRNK